MLGGLWEAGQVDWNDRTNGLLERDRSFLKEHGYMLLSSGGPFLFAFPPRVGSCVEGGACPNKNKNFTCLALTARAIPSPCPLISLLPIPDQPWQHTFFWIVKYVIFAKLCKRKWEYKDGNHININLCKLIISWVKDTWIKFPTQGWMEVSYIQR